MSAIFRYSSWQTTVERDDEQKKLHTVEFHDFVRGLCGGLFFAVPLHFTMEMWVRARIIPCWDIIIILAVAYLANVGYNLFSSFKSDMKQRAAWFDALSAMGIGFLASAITMSLIDQITPEISFEIVLKMIALEAVPTSFGASLAMNQLGGGKKKEEKKIQDQYSADFRKILGAALGALLFSFNIAPTTEPIVISSSIGWYQLIAIIFFSLVLSYAMNFIAGFAKKDEREGRIMGSKWAETVVAYAISLVVSAMLLWAFGYLTPTTPIGVALPWIIVLGYVTSLGSSAGRLIL